MTMLVKRLTNRRVEGIVKNVGFTRNKPPEVRGRVAESFYELLSTCSVATSHFLSKVHGASPA